ncbi:MAG: hypothetical protein E7504_08480 [Ruminococcus sp.]|nr:hypothetical protein [Ruminococcus sp.]
MMPRYKKPYFKLFTAICDVIEEIESATQTMEPSDETRQLLEKQIEQLKAAQQDAEEEYISVGI